jgi:hypothetical protein
MAITAMTSALSAQLQSTFNTGLPGTPTSNAVRIASAIASIVPSGQIYVGISWVPVIPAGVAACQAMLNTAFNTGLPGTPSSSSQIMASAIAALAPMVPSVGVTILKSMLQNIDNMGLSGSASTTSQMMASAIIAYFTAGGVI